MSDGDKSADPLETPQPFKVDSPKPFRADRIGGKSSPLSSGSNPLFAKALLERIGKACKPQTTTQQTSAASKSTPSDNNNPRAITPPATLDLPLTTTVAGDSKTTVNGASSRKTSISNSSENNPSPCSDTSGSIAKRKPAAVERNLHLQIPSIGTNSEDSSTAGPDVATADTGDEDDPGTAALADMVRSEAIEGPAPRTAELLNSLVSIKGSTPQILHLGTTEANATFTTATQTLLNAQKAAIQDALKNAPGSKPVAVKPDPAPLNVQQAVTMFPQSTTAAETTSSAPRVQAFPTTTTQLLTNLVTSSAALNNPSPGGVQVSLGLGGGHTSNLATQAPPTQLPTMTQLQGQLNASSIIAAAQSIQQQQQAASATPMGTSAPSAAPRLDKIVNLQLRLGDRLITVPVKLTPEQQLAMQNGGQLTLSQPLAQIASGGALTITQPTQQLQVNPAASFALGASPQQTALQQQMQGINSSQHPGTTQVSLADAQQLITQAQIQAPPKPPVTNKTISNDELRAFRIMKALQDNLPGRQHEFNDFDSPRAASSTEMDFESEADRRANEILMAVTSGRTSDLGSSIPSNTTMEMTVSASSLKYNSVQERNKLAAVRYRKRKKDELLALQKRVVELETKNLELTTQVNVLKDELDRVNDILDEHRDCPINKRRRLDGSFMPLDAKSTLSSTLLAAADSTQMNGQQQQIMIDQSRLRQAPSAQVHQMQQQSQQPHFTTLQTANPGVLGGATTISLGDAASTEYLFTALAEGSKGLSLPQGVTLTNATGFGNSPSIDASMFVRSPSSAGTAAANGLLSLSQSGGDTNFVLPSSGSGSDLTTVNPTNAVVEFLTAKKMAAVASESSTGTGSVMIASSGAQGGTQQYVATTSGNNIVLQPIMIPGLGQSVLLPYLQLPSSSAGGPLTAILGGHTTSATTNVSFSSPAGIQTQSVLGQVVVSASSAE